MKQNTKKVVGLGLFTAIVVVLQLLGSVIKFGPFSVSLVLIPIVVGTAIYGVGAGAWLGLVFGVTVLASGDAAAFLTVNAIGTVITVLLKGTLAGTFAGLVYKALERFNKYLAVIAAAVAFILNYAFYFSEIFRGGIQGVPVGQREAGEVLGMTKTQIFFHVTLLQMVKKIVPPMSNEIITLVKDTSLARIIALQEIIWAGEAFMKGSHGISGQIWPLFFTGIYYLAFSGLLTVLFSRIEKKLGYFKI